MCFVTSLRLAVACGGRRQDQTNRQLQTQVFGSGRFAGSGVEDTAIIQELEAAYSAAISREGDSKLADALLNKEQVGSTEGSRLM